MPPKQKRKRADVPDGNQGKRWFLRLMLGAPIAGSEEVLKVSIAGHLRSVTHLTNYPSLPQEAQEGKKIFLDNKTDR